MMKSSGQGLAYEKKKKRVIDKDIWQPTIGRHYSDEIQSYCLISYQQQEHTHNIDKILYQTLSHAFHFIFYIVLFFLKSGVLYDKYVFIHFSVCQVLFSFGAKSTVTVSMLRLGRNSWGKKKMVLVFLSKNMCLHNEICMDTVTSKTCLLPKKKKYPFLHVSRKLYGTCKTAKWYKDMTD